MKTRKFLRLSSVVETACRPIKLVGVDEYGAVWYLKEGKAEVSWRRLPMRKHPGSLELEEEELNQST